MKKTGLIIAGVIAGMCLLSIGLVFGDDPGLFQPKQGSEASSPSAIKPAQQKKLNEVGLKPSPPVFLVVNATGNETEAEVTTDTVTAKTNTTTNP